MAQQPPTAKESPAGASRAGLASLHRLARRRSAEEHCELCSAPLGAEHPHLLELKTRSLVCACDPCAILFSGQQSARYQRVPRRVLFLPEFCLTDQAWESLNIPISLAFFVRSMLAGKVLAIYPSPGGPTEANLPLDSWQELAEANPVLSELQPDVEALLVNRIGPTREHYLVPLDACYRLVGLIRCHWRGLSGGTEVWRKITEFFAQLKERAGAG